MMRLFSRYGLEFDGTGRITIPDSEGIRIKGEFAVVVQFKVNDVSESVIMKKENEYELVIDSDGRLRFGVYDGADYEPAVIGCKVEAGRWYKVVLNVMVIAEKIVKQMIVNGTEKYVEDRQTGEIANSSNDLIVALNFKGVIDCIMFYNRVLNENEVASIMNGEFVPYGLEVFFSIEEGEGSEVYDVVHSGYKGSVVGGRWVMGRDMENVYMSRSKVVLVRRYM